MKKFKPKTKLISNEAKLIMNQVEISQIHKSLLNI